MSRHTPSAQLGHARPLVLHDSGGSARFIEIHGEDLPEISDWSWPDVSSEG